MSEYAPIGRREFVGVIASAAAAGLVGQGSGVAFAGGVTINVKTATAASFQSYVGQTFKVSGSSAPFTLDSVNVVNDPNKSKRPTGIRSDSFSLIFTAPKGTQLKAGSYTFSNASVNAVSLFVTEVRPTSTFSTNSTPGIVEQLATGIAANISPPTPKAYFEVPFN